MTPPSVARHGDHRVVLDVQLLLVADAVGALDHQVRLREARLDVARGRPRSAANCWSRPAGRRRPAAARSAGGSRRASRHAGRPIGCREQCHGFGVVPDPRRREDRLVGLDGADDVLAGDVLRRHDHDAGPVEPRVELHAEEPGVRLGRADRGAVPGAGNHDVVACRARRRSACRVPRAAAGPATLRAGRPGVAPGATSGCTTGVDSVRDRR